MVARAGRCCRWSAAWCGPRAGPPPLRCRGLSLARFCFWPGARGPGTVSHVWSQTVIVCARARVCFRTSRDRCFRNGRGARVPRVLKYTPVLGFGRECSRGIANAAAPRPAARRPRPQRRSYPTVLLLSGMYQQKKNIHGRNCLGLIKARRAARLPRAWAWAARAQTPHLRCAPRLARLPPRPLAPRPLGSRGRCAPNHPQAGLEAGFGAEWHFIAPIAPRGEAFFMGAERLLPALCAAVRPPPRSPCHPALLRARACTRRRVPCNQSARRGALGAGRRARRSPSATRWRGASSTSGGAAMVRPVRVQQAISSRRPCSSERASAAAGPPERPSAPIAPPRGRTHDRASGARSCSAGAPLRCLSCSGSGAFGAPSPVLC